MVYKRWMLCYLNQLVVDFDGEILYTVGQQYLSDKLKSIVRYDKVSKKHYIPIHLSIKRWLPASGSYMFLYRLDIKLSFWSKTFSIDTSYQQPNVTDGGEFQRVRFGFSNCIPYAIHLVISNYLNGLLTKV